MATTQPIVRQRGLQTILAEGGRMKEQADRTAESFATSANSPLRTLHPSLQLPGPSENAGALVAVKPAEQAVTTTESPAPEPPDESTAVSAEVIEEESRFKAAMIEYEAGAREKFKTGVDPAKKHTMEELWNVIDTAVDNYQSKEKNGVWGKIRLAFRKLGENGKAFEGWLGLLPEESEYFSVVCGGLKLIIGAASRMRTVAEKVLEALQKIPAVLSGAERVLGIFEDSEQLKEQSTALYRSMLLALGHMLEYLKRKSFIKIIGAVFKQQAFESQLMAKIDNITKERDAFNEEAEICHKEVLAQLAKTSEKNADEIKDELRGISQVLAVYTAEQRRARRDFTETLKVVGMSYEYLQHEVVSFKKDVRNDINMLQKPMKEMLRLLKANPKGIETAYAKNKLLEYPDGAPEQRIARRSSTFSIMKGKGKTPARSPRAQRNAFLQQLDYDANIAGADVVANYILGSDLSKDDQERSLWVIKSRALARWVKSEQSAVLVVNGQAKRVMRKSGLTFVCARLIYALDQIREPDQSQPARPDLIPTHFFCGQHDTDEETWASPSGVINSLVAQVVSQCKDVNLGKIDNLGEFDSDDIKAVFERFKLLLKELPAKSVVFCIIDGLSFYVDDDDKSNDAIWLATKLLRLAKKSPKGQCVLKVLLTAPNRLRVSEVDELEGDEVLNIPATLPNTGGFTAMKWDFVSRPQLESFGSSQGA